MTARLWMEPGSHRWCVVDEGHLLRIGRAARIFYRRQDSLRRALRRCGLWVQRDRTVAALPPEPRR